MKLYLKLIINYHLKPKGFWKILCPPLLLFSIEFLWTVNFLRQLSKVVDLKVSLKNWWLLKILLFFLIVLSVLFIGWLLKSVLNFLVWGIPVHPPHPLEVTISRLSLLISFLPGLLACIFLFARFYLFLNKTLFLVSNGNMRVFLFSLLSLLCLLRFFFDLPLIFVFTSFFLERITVKSLFS